MKKERFEDEQDGYEELFDGEPIEETESEDAVTTDGYQSSEEEYEDIDAEENSEIDAGETDEDDKDAVNDFAEKFFAFSRKAGIAIGRGLRAVGRWLWNFLKNLPRYIRAYYKGFCSVARKTPLRKVRKPLLFGFVHLLLLLVIVIVCAVSCGKKDSKPKEPKQEESKIEESSALINEESSSLIELEKPTEVKVQKENDALTEEIKPGKLYYFDAAEPEHVITGISIDGNVAGTYDTETSINGRPFAKENIRSVFELMEWVTVSFESKKEDAQSIELYVLMHQKDANYYMTDKPEDYPRIGVLESQAADDGNYYYIQFFIDPEDQNEPGLYDLVFVYKDKPIAMTEIEFTAEGKLSGLSDAEIQALMNK